MNIYTDVDQPRATATIEVVGLEDLSGGFRGGDYDGRAVEADEHDGAIRSGEFSQRVVRAGGVEIAYDGERWRPRREFLLFVIEVIHRLEEEERKGKSSPREM